MTNLLDLDNVTLNIIGDDVKINNTYRIEEQDFEQTGKIINNHKGYQNLNKYEIKEVLYSSLFKKCYQPEDIKKMSYQ